MPISAPGRLRNDNAARPPLTAVREPSRPPAAGFTLIELAVVMLLLVIILGMVGVNLTRGPGDVVRDEAQRLALLLQTAQQEAILEGRFYAFAPTLDGYEFLRLDDSGNLVAVAAGDPLGPRVLPRSVTLELADLPPPAENEVPLVVFEPSGAVPRFTLILQAEQTVWYVEAGGNGRIRSAVTRARDEV